ncbi:MAG TPA: sodium:solute symporter [Bacteroidia bacterium]|nr:sodium:solute symporter [Bacteroidia bacterium]
MSIIDWVVLLLTLLGIAVYGIYKSRGTKNIEGYLLADRKLPWYHVGFSVMATQASAITFLSAPGQAFSDGMRFVQFYFGLPLAMVVLCITFIPAFHKLNVYTAYEYLEKRFDLKTRSLTAFLFLLQRGLSTGITIYAPAIVLSTILKIDITYTTVLMGGIVILYTISGGTKAVSFTQLFQMGVIFSGLIVAAILVVYKLPYDVSFSDSLHIAGSLGKMNLIDTTFDWNNRYNIWSGIIGGFFLQLSYFGTDQSQVGRYLTGSSVTQSRLGLIMNGLIKIPMQFFILMIGILVFTFYQYHEPPVFFNPVETSKIEQSKYNEDYQKIKKDYTDLHHEKLTSLNAFVAALHSDDESKIKIAKLQLNQAEHKLQACRKGATDLMLKHNAKADVNDSNYVFLTFVMNFLPVGMIGLIIAIIFLASMGSTASGLNSLAGTFIVDFYKRLIKKDNQEINYLKASRWATASWGVFCIIVALYASRLGNLIEAVNILGSLFYGTILGIFLVAFYVKHVKAQAVFIAACLAEVFIIVAWQLDLTAFLWLNVLGCILVVGMAILLQMLLPSKKEIIE